MEGVKGMRIGIPEDYFGEGLEEQVKAPIMAAVKGLQDKGAVVEEFSLSLVKYAIPAYYVIASAEASSNLARFDGVKYGYRAGDEGELSPDDKRAGQKVLEPRLSAGLCWEPLSCAQGIMTNIILRLCR